MSLSGEAPHRYRGHPVDEQVFCIASAKGLSSALGSGASCVSLGAYTLRALSPCRMIPFVTHFHYY